MADHDSGYKQLFSHADMVRDLLQGFVKEEWVGHLDYSSLEKVSGSYVTDDLRDRQDDIIWRVRWGKEWIYVYLVLEFQSTVDWIMAVRMNAYVMLLYQNLVKSGQVKPGEPLPPVLPLALYNGKPVWTAAMDVADLIAPLPQGLIDTVRICVTCSLTRCAMRTLSWPVCKTSWRRSVDWKRAIHRRISAPP